MIDQLEKKKQDYDLVTEKRKQFQAQLQLCNQQELREKEEIDKISQELSQTGMYSGYQSEPTTPPDRRDQSFSSSMFSRSNRYSTSSFTSPLGNTRSSRSGSQLASPPSELANIPPNPTGADFLPSKSVPSSRRGSNDRATSYVPETNGSARRNATS